jgi:hypothetical protein
MLSRPSDVNPPEASASSADPCVVEGIQPSESPEIFERLTANRWSEDCPSDDPDFPPSCNFVLLRADGSYSWTRSSDVEEYSSSGDWSYVLLAESSGLMRLGEDHVFEFALVDEGLELGPLRTLIPGAALDDSGAITLPPFELPDLHCELVRGPWFKANAFDEADTPDQLDFHLGNTVTASYRDGECQHEVNWLLDDFTTYWELQPNECHGYVESRPRTLFIDWELDARQGRLWILHHPYRRTPSEISEFFDRSAFQIEGTLDGPLRAGQPATMEGTVTHLGQEGLTISRLTISLVDDASPTPDSEASVLADFDLDGGISGDESQPFEATITPPNSGSHTLSFAASGVLSRVVDAEFSDSIQYQVTVE